jgi:hypothetical protein
MKTETFNIPEKLVVGYQNRDDTYTGQLGYVVYRNKKGEIAKAISWEGWRDKKIDSQEFDNVPTEGFVLNKKVGGAGYSYGWNVRKTYSRIYDPRGFEFEITIENLLFILQECDCTKGKGLEGEFVYAWRGKDLVLLPVSSEDYKLSRLLLDKIEKITMGNLVVGALYKAKNIENLVYIGKHDWFYFTGLESDGINYSECILARKSLPTFYNPDEDSFHGTDNMKNLYFCKNETYTASGEVADYVDSFKNTYFGGADRIKSFTVKGEAGFYYADNDKIFELSYNNNHKFTSYRYLCFQDHAVKSGHDNANVLTLIVYYRDCYSNPILNPDHPSYKAYEENEKRAWAKRQKNIPCAVLENGKICPIPSFVQFIYGKLSDYYLGTKCLINRYN